MTIPYIKGEAGLSAYQLWLASGNTGTLADFFEDMRGDDGAPGSSPYDLAVLQGYPGTLDEWLATLVGASAYQTAVDAGFLGTQAEWLLTLVGANGLTPMYTLAQPFTMPAFDATNTAVFTEPPALALLGQPYYMEGAGTLRVAGLPTGNTIALMNPNVNWGLNVPSHPEVSGVPGNATAGTVIPLGNRMTPGGRPGFQGFQGLQGDQGDTGGSTPGDDGTDGSRIMFLNVDPNTQPSSYGAIGDMVIQNDVPGEFTYWEKTGAAVWGNRGTVTGSGAPAISAQVFRVGKTTVQPIAMGSVVPTVVQFENSTSPGLYNGGWWNGSSWEPQAGLTTPQTFNLQSMRIFRTAGGGETITFTIDIEVKLTVEGTGNIAITSPATEGTNALITTGPTVVDAASISRIIITPSVAPTQQWFIDLTALFYNQI